MSVDALDEFRDYVSEQVEVLRANLDLWVYHRFSPTLLEQGRRPGALALQAPFGVSGGAGRERPNCGARELVDHGSYPWEGTFSEASSPTCQDCDGHRCEFPHMLGIWEHLRVC